MMLLLPGDDDADDNGDDVVVSDDVVDVVDAENGVVSILYNKRRKHTFSKQPQKCYSDDYCIGNADVTNNKLQICPIWQCEK